MQSTAYDTYPQTAKLSILITMSKFTWPDGFLWGAATSAHQVEGNNVNNWSVFELAHAAERARGAEARYHDFAIWPDIKELATDPDNYVSGLASDHYRRYHEDFEIAAELGFNAFRFSIEWSRLEPKAGRWDAEAFAHYHTYIRAMKARGLEPVMTLYHWTHPLWFEQKGAFASGSNIKYFLRFVDKVAREFGEDVHIICTVNEPDTVMMQGYVEGTHAPGMRHALTALRVYHNLLKSHKKAYAIWKQRYPEAFVGMTKTFAHVGSAGKRLSSRVAVRLDYFFRDDVTVRYVRRRTDFLGVQFYFTDRYDGFGLTGSDLPVSDLNWGMQPENLELILKRLGRYRVPLIVTETGVADMHDRYRTHWLQQTIISVRRALEAGVDMRGYLHWSFMDNFEWAEGRWPRFGLVEIEYERGLKRQVRKSARYYAEVIEKARRSE